MVSKKKQTLFDKNLAIFLGICSILIIAFGSFYIYQYHHEQTLKTELATKTKKAEKRNKANAENTIKNELAASNSNVSGTQSDAKVLFKALFQYSSWKTYAEHSITLAQTYPKLASNDLIDTDASNAGSGNSAPSSIYKINATYLNQEEQSMVYLVTQTVKSETVTYTKDYYIKVAGSGSDFDVKDFKVLKKLTTY